MWIHLKISSFNFLLAHKSQMGAVLTSNVSSKTLLREMVSLRWQKGLSGNIIFICEKNKLKKKHAVGYLQQQHFFS